jgi:hypothetical protein
MSKHSVKVIGRNTIRIISKNDPRGSLFYDMLLDINFKRRAVRKTTNYKKLGYNVLIVEIE